MLMEYLKFIHTHNTWSLSTYIISLHHVEMWDDDPQFGGDDFIDNFTTANMSSLLDFDRSNSLNVTGMLGIGTITLTLFNLTTNPMTCNAGDSGTCVQHWRLILWLYSCS